MAKDQTQSKETPTFEDLKHQCENYKNDDNFHIVRSEQQKEREIVPDQPKTFRNDGDGAEPGSAQPSSRATAVEMRRKAREERRKLQKLQRGNKNH